MFCAERRTIGSISASLSSCDAFQMLAMFVSATAETAAGRSRFCSWLRVRQDVRRVSDVVPHRASDILLSHGWQRHVSIAVRVVVAVAAVRISIASATFLPPSMLAQPASSRPRELLSKHEREILRRTCSLRCQRR